jgi:copper chaperone CopZ
MAAEHSIRTIRLQVAGMGCDGCVSSVRQALEAVPGVISAQVDLQGAAAKVEAEASTEPAALIAAVDAAGYEAAVA